uniref:Uncharacterized protein n=1 Tax=Anguilla anguilla TaxID=7936 RepID=A0A0E9SKW2_ANGAN
MLSFHKSPKLKHYNLTLICHASLMRFKILPNGFQA